MGLHVAFLRRRVARLAFLTPNLANLALFRDTWRQKNLFGFLTFSFQYLAVFKAIGTYHQTGVSASYLAEKCY